MAVVGAGLLVTAPAFPLVLAAGCLTARLRAHAPWLLIAAPLPALALAPLVSAAPAVVLQRGLAPIILALDLPGAMLLFAAALLWLGGAFYVRSADRSGEAMSGQFAACWLLTLAGSMGVFIAADLASFFLAYALVSIPAWGLIVYDDTPRSRRAGAVYIAFTVLGETLLMMGFVLLAVPTPGGSLLMRDTLAALSSSPWRGATLALIITGFAMKIGLVPLHMWLPLSYRAAPIPAAAVLSGAGVNAGVIGLIRFLPDGIAPSGWGLALAAAGLFTAFYGVVIGITQAHPKTVLAYSSVSQMGLIATVLGMGVDSGDAQASLATAFYAAQHLLAKGALFLAVGVASVPKVLRVWTVLLPASILALGLAGLPLTGGALAKLALKESLGSGFVSELATLSAAGSTLLMLHFLRRLTSITQYGAPAAPDASVRCWLAMAAISLALPWVLYPLVASGQWLAPGALWSATWPLLGGVVLAILLWRFSQRLPVVPEGDLLAVGRRLAPVAGAWANVLESAECKLRQWPAASLSLAASALILAAAMLAGR
jgi:formate hydrogenlyase subunit 3/multisubunit Na+/H+ antiporter MnhD subunit